MPTLTAINYHLTSFPRAGEPLIFDGVKYEVMRAETAALLIREGCPLLADEVARSGAVARLYLQRPRGRHVFMLQLWRAQVKGYRYQTSRLKKIY